MLTTAQNYVKSGIAVIPLWWRQKTPRIGGWREYQDRLPRTDELKKWFAHRRSNIAIVTGWQNLAVIDFDDAAKFEEWQRWATAGEAALVKKETRRVLTAKGVHLYVTTARQTTNAQFTGGDIRATGGYVVAPPSVHPLGAQYIFDNAAAPIVTVSNVEAILPAGWITKTAPVTTVDTELPARRNVWDYIDTGSASVERIRQSVSILDYFPDVERSSRDGRWYKTRCPFHRDGHPSFWIDARRGLCGCHVCGGKVMDVINLHARLHNIDNRSAIIELGRR
jgi:hypothetical protein